MIIKTDEMQVLDALRSVAAARPEHWAAPSELRQLLSLSSWAEEDIADCLVRLHRKRLAARRTVFGRWCWLITDEGRLARHGSGSPAVRADRIAAASARLEAAVREVEAAAAELSRCVQERT
jgi:hypothetical protein